MSLSDKTRKLVNYLDSQIYTISLDGIDRDYLIVKEIIPIFTNYILNNINNIINLIQKDKLDLSFKKDPDLDILKEALFRNAVWGYLYRLTEEQFEL